MDDLGDQVLPGAGFPQEQDGVIGPGHGLTPLQQRLDGRGFPDKLGVAQAFPEQLSEVAVLFGQGPDLQGAAHGGQESFFLKGLGQVVKGPLLDQLHGRGDGTEGGQGDKRDLRRNGIAVPQEVETAERLHEQIGKNQVEGLFVQQAGGFFPLRCGNDFILLGRSIRFKIWQYRLSSSTTRRRGI